MVKGINTATKPKESAVELAIAGIVGRPSLALPDDGGRIGDNLRRRNSASRACQQWFGSYERIRCGRGGQS